VRDCWNVPAGQRVVTCIAWADDALLCVDDRNKVLLLPRECFRLVGADQAPVFAFTSPVTGGVDKGPPAARSA
jgi:hypothetical protein